MSDKTYVDDIGTIIELDCGVDITDATTTTIKVLKPDEIEYEWAGTIYNSNYIRYTVLSGDFDQAGIFSIQAYIETPDGQWSGETVQFTVYEEYL